MNKNDFKTVKLDKGEMHVYDFGGVKLHAYKTDDPINDEVFLLEKTSRRLRACSYPITRRAAIL